MIECPRCRSAVDETTRTTCPNCSAPIGGQPAAATPHAAPSTARPGARVSLTGEVIESEAPPVNPTPSLYGNSPQAVTHQVAPIPTRPVPPTASRSTYRPAYPQREAAPEKSYALIINLSVVLVLLLLSGGAGWWFWAHRTNPKSQVQRYLHAIQWLDWGVVYDLSATPPGNQTRHEFINKMDDKFDNNGVIKIAARRNMEKIPFTVAEPTIHGDEATVPAAVDGHPVEFRLKNFGGVWKIYPLADNPLDILQGI